MKTIIALTDYSGNATNAMDYAAALAREAKVRLVLYHAFPHPVTTDMAFFEMMLNSAAAEHLNRLQIFKKSVESRYGVEVICRAEAGSVAENLPALMIEENAELAVAGLRGANPALSLIMGSNTTEILRRGEVPLLIVPGAATFNAPERILFACDNPMIENPALLRPLQEIAALFDSALEVYRIDAPEARPGATPPTRPGNLETHFQRIRHVYTFEIAESVRESILRAVVQSKADLLAMIPHHHSIWAYLFDQSDTLNVALQTTVPTLVLAEKTKVPSTEQAAT